MARPEKITRKLIARTDEDGDSFWAFWADARTSQALLCRDIVAEFFEDASRWDRDGATIWLTVSRRPMCRNSVRLYVQWDWETWWWGQTKGRELSGVLYDAVDAILNKLLEQSTNPQVVYLTVEYVEADDG